jgi:hypothetical protein
MKSLFFSFISRIAFGVLAGIVFAGCGIINKNEGLPPEADFYPFRIIDKSHQNLLGLDSGQINACKIKIFNIKKHEVPNGCYIIPRESVSLTTEEDRKIYGSGLTLTIGVGDFNNPQNFTDNGNEALFYIVLPNGDQDTLSVNKDGYFYNGIKSITYDAYICLIKDNN